MKLFGLVFVGMLLPVATWAVPVTVDYIFDGDTFSGYVNLGDDVRVAARVRIRNIDTPEMHGACDAETELANRARVRLGELIPIGTTVELENIKDDKYLGRIDANVILSDGRDVGDILITEKLGRRYNGGHRPGWCNN